ncbi:hypothetical protein [Pelagibius sp.]|uniref:hypothetical protein n=1 Tax=Pelagibius sp. TaxID=1931238 RepID=UPI00261DDDF1|nr:hypothetical protein [Pelagibius sp.]
MYRRNLGRFNIDRPYVWTRDMVFNGKRVKKGQTVSKKWVARHKLKQLYETRRIALADGQPPETPGNRSRAKALNATVAAVGLMNQEGLTQADVKGTGKDGRVVINDVRRAVKALHASLLKKAEKAGIDVVTIPGSGPKGAVTVADLRKALKAAEDRKAKA